MRSGSYLEYPSKEKQRVKSFDLSQFVDTKSKPFETKDSNYRPRNSATVRTVRKSSRS